MHFKPDDAEAIDIKGLDLIYRDFQNLDSRMN